MPKKIDLTGQRFGRLLVLYECGRAKNGDVLWKCRCDCGNECVVDGCNLRRGNHTSSCGCLVSDHIREIATKHGLSRKHWRLYDSIFHHFKWIRQSHSGYSQWVLDSRYSDDTDGVAKFCYDLIALQPEMCERYEWERMLDLDKDNSDEHIFCPQCIKFVSLTENRSKKPNNLFLQGDTKTRFVDFLKRVGIPTRINGKKNPQYDNARSWFRTHNGEGHPELIKRANELICLYTKTLKMVKLLEDVRRFASAADVQKLLQTSSQESV